MKREPSASERERFSRILTVAAQVFGVTPEAITGRSRLRRHSQPRMFVCVIAYEIGISTCGIAGLLDRDHSTVCDAKRRFERAFAKREPWAVRAMAAWARGSFIEDEQEAIAAKLQEIYALRDRMRNACYVVEAAAEVLA